MALEFYWGSGSPYAWRVMLALEHKGIPYESRMLSFSQGEHKTDGYRAISPRGKVPAIRDGAFTLSESVAILAYLDARYPERPLLGTTPEETGRIWRAVSDFGAYLEPPMYAVIGALFFGRVAGREEAVQADIAAMHRELPRVEAQLAQQPWLAGETLTAADFVAFPIYPSLLRAAGKPDAARVTLDILPLETRYPAIAAWVGRIEALPFYQRTYPPHWREG